MAFESAMYPGEVIIDDSMGLTNKVINGKVSAGFKYGRGLNLKLKGGYCSGLSAAKPFPSELAVPKNEWKDWIAEMEEKKTRLSDLMNQAGLPCKDQSQTNYCWINAPTHTVEMNRVVQNQPMVILSPASVGGPLTNFRNVGGWGGPAFVGIDKMGLCPVEKWPANAIDRSYWTEENKALALFYRQTEWYELPERDLESLISALLRRVPIAGGYNWWSHEITNYDPVWVNNAIGVRIRNSWSMDWPTAGAGGYSILQGSRMLADDAVGPTATIAA